MATCRACGKPMLTEQPHRHIKALNVTREEAADIIHDTLTDMGVLRWPTGVSQQELAQAKAAQARRNANLPQGAV